MNSGEPNIPLPGDYETVIFEPPSVKQVQIASPHEFEHFFQTQGNPITALVMERDQQKDYRLEIEADQKILKNHEITRDCGVLHELCAFEDEMARTEYSDAAFAEAAIAKANHEIDQINAEIAQIKKKQAKWEKRIQELKERM